MEHRIRKLRLISLSVPRRHKPMKIFCFLRTNKHLYSHSSSLIINTIAVQPYTLKPTTWGRSCRASFQLWHILRHISMLLRSLIGLKKAPCNAYCIFDDRSQARRLRHTKEFHREIVLHVALSYHDRRGSIVRLLRESFVHTFLKMVHIGIRWISVRLCSERKIIII